MAELSLYHRFLLLLLLPASAKPFSLHKTRFEETDNSILYEGGAYISVGGIHLNSDLYQCQAGHATYIEKVQIWDSKTQKLTDFSTRFSSIVDMQRRPVAGSGFAFFFAPVDYRIPPNSAGGFLGIYNITNMNSSPYKIVHIEFDSTPDPGWDPPFQHVAININSLSSVAYTRWNTTLHSGDAAIVWITYDSTTRNLTVFWDYQTTCNSLEKMSLSYIVDLREVLPEWVLIGFSASTADFLEQHSILSWDFSSSLETDERNHNNAFKIKLLVLATVIPASFLILAVILAFGICWTRKLMKGIIEMKNLESIKDDLENGPGRLRRISYMALVSATKNFSSESKLGKQEFGATYRGYFAHLKMAVAIKKIKCISKQEKKELITQVKNISQLRYPNLVRLLGWCHEKDEFLLVYEFVPSSSLDSHLFGNKGTLPWDMRYRIANGLASALLYLHEEWEECVLHKHVKSSNIMLDSDFNVKLGGFGLAETKASVRDLGYSASEYARTCRGNKVSDVHSFGLVALEIATGKKATDLNLVEWVGEHYRNGTLILAADNKLGVGFDEKEMECLLIVGIWCGQPDEDVRPSSMWQVIHVLNFHALLPNLSTNSMRSSTLPPTSYRESQMSCSSTQ